MQPTNQNPWKTLDSFVKISSPWVTLIGDRLQDDKGKIIDYWRVERADSVVIITLHNEQLLFPIPMYRPGIGKITLDFAGGRVSGGETPAIAALKIIKKELGITEDAIARLTPINSVGWSINSSFSNQTLYGFVAELYPTVTVNSDFLGATYPVNPAGFSTLLKDLTCLQCRAVFLEWQSQYI